MFVLILSLHFSIIPFSIRTNQWKTMKQNKGYAMKALQYNTHAGICRAPEMGSRGIPTPGSELWLACGNDWPQAEPQQTHGTSSVCFTKEISMDSGTRQVKAKQSGTSNKTCVALQRPKQKATDNNYTNIISCICSFPLCGGVWI